MSPSEGTSSASRLSDIPRFPARAKRFPGMAYHTPQKCCCCCLAICSGNCQNRSFGDPIGQLYLADHGNSLFYSSCNDGIFSRYDRRYYDSIYPINKLSVCVRTQKLPRVLTELLSLFYPESYLSNQKSIRTLHALKNMGRAQAAYSCAKN